MIWKLEMIRKAHELDLLTTPMYLIQKMPKRWLTGADILVAHMGLTTKVL